MVYTQLIANKILSESDLDAMNRAESREIFLQAIRDLPVVNP